MVVEFLWFWGRGGCAVYKYGDDFYPGATCMRALRGRSHLTNQPRVHHSGYTMAARTSLDHLVFFSPSMSPDHLVHLVLGDSFSSLCLSMAHRSGSPMMMHEFHDSASAISHIISITSSARQKTPKQQDNELGTEVCFCSPSRTRSGRVALKKPKRTRSSLWTTT